MFSAAQLRAARYMIDWTRNELAEAAKVSPETIKNIEHGIFRPQEETAERIVRTFAQHGVEFTDDEGVKLRKDSIYRFEGVEEFKKFMDDVYEAAQQPDAKIGGEKQVCVSSFDDRMFDKYLGDYYVMHAKRVAALGNIRVRVLVQEAPQHALPEEKADKGGYREYRKHPKGALGSVPFYVYGDKLAFMQFDEKTGPQIVVINSAPVAKTYRALFDALWEEATPCGGLSPLPSKSRKNG